MATLSRYSVEEGSRAAAAVGFFLARVRDQYPVRDAYLFDSRASGSISGGQRRGCRGSAERGEPVDFHATKRVLAGIADEVLLDTGTPIQPLPRVLRDTPVLQQIKIRIPEGRYPGPTSPEDRRSFRSTFGASMVC